MTISDSNLEDYDHDLTPEENQARALFAIAAAIRGLLYGMKYSTSEGLSIAEAIYKAREEANASAHDSAVMISEALDDHAKDLVAAVEGVERETS